ncbi:hypothetical protein PCCS19_18680 [Paenibacillus sp. CCS19]|nr:hypothetical protein PCCS19_18680 [Paenibacillus cellulosilyticus]
MMFRKRKSRTKKLSIIHAQKQEGAILDEQAVIQRAFNRNAIPHRGSLNAKKAVYIPYVGNRLNFMVETT